MIKEVLKESKECLKGRTFKAICFVALYVSLVFMFTSQELIVTLLMLPLEFGVYRYFLNFIKGTEKMEDIIEYYIDFKKGLKLALALFWYIVIVLFGLLLFVVPGFVFSYRYILSVFLLIENDDMSIEEAFNMSKQMMRGYKFKFFITPMIITLLPLIIYLVGLGIISSSALAMNTLSYDELEIEVVEEEVIESVQEDVIIENEENLDTPITEVLEENESEESLDNEEIKNVGMLFVGLFIFMIGVIWLLLISPRAIVAEVLLYEKIKKIHEDKNIEQK